MTELSLQPAPFLGGQEDADEFPNNSTPSPNTHTPTPLSWLISKESAVMLEMQVQSLGREDPLEKEMATHSSILVWEIPWTEESDSL